MSDTKIAPEYSQDRALGNLELAVVVPTFNEIENIVRLIDAVQAALDEHAFEIIVVDDDSPDGTADQVRKIAQRNLRVRCIQRIGRRGLSSAFVEGALATAAPVVAAIDGDMQHDEKMLPVMLKTLLSRDLEVVVGSRYLEQGGTGDWTESRILSSQIATMLARRVTGVKLSDPMSGFFMIRTDVLRRPGAETIGRGLQDPTRHLCLRSHPAPVSGASISFPREIFGQKQDGREDPAGVR